MLLNKKPELNRFADTVVSWQRVHGRHHLPWQGSGEAYRIWLSEIMLQQTQVSTVIDYYARFLERFPDIPTLAAATQDEVMPYWAGLGYYARARNLHRCAVELSLHWNNTFPPTSHEIATLPGIGRSTAAAIAAFAYAERSPIMDGNVKRVFTRYFGIYGVTSQRSTEKLLWDTAEAVLDSAPASLPMAAYTQGLMDLGSSCCSRSTPQCHICPLSSNCYAHLNGKQQELPTPKVRKTVPERHCKMLILDRDGHVLLEQQASPGIWGGLWSLPKYPDAETLESACINHGERTEPAQKMAALLHVFSHFKLHIEPWYLRSELISTEEPQPGQAWVPIHALPSTALPAPVRKILTGLYPPTTALPDDNG